MTRKGTDYKTGLLSWSWKDFQPKRELRWGWLSTEEHQAKTQLEWKKGNGKRSMRDLWSLLQAREQWGNHPRLLESPTYQW